MLSEEAGVDDQGLLDGIFNGAVEGCCDFREVLRVDHEVPTQVNEFVLDERVLVMQIGRSGWQSGGDVSKEEGGDARNGKQIPKSHHE